MTEIDLHGFKHDEVEDKLANLLILHYNMGNFPVTLITGKSERMKTRKERTVLSGLGSYQTSVGRWKEKF